MFATVYRRILKEKIRDTPTGFGTKNDSQRSYKNESKSARRALATVDAFRDHGKLAATLEQNLGEAAETLEQIEKAGINLDEAMLQLQNEGVAGFVKPFENLTAALVKKHESIACAMGK